MKYLDKAWKAYDKGGISGLVSKAVGKVGKKADETFESFKPKNTTVIEIVDIEEINAGIIVEITEGCVKIYVDGVEADSKIYSNTLITTIKNKAIDIMRQNINML